MLTTTASRNFRTLFLRGAMVAAGAALSCGAGLAADDVTLVFQEKDGHVKAAGSFLVEADPQVAWDVLSDYSHIPDFVHNLKVSHIQIREGNDVLLRQEGEGGFLFFTQRVRLFLYIKETPNQSIVFKDLAHKDFKTYDGSWRIAPENGGKDVKVTYQLEADLNFAAPAFLVNDAMSGGAKDLLKSVRKEILLRQVAKTKLDKEILQVTRQTQTPVEK